MSSLQARTRIATAAALFISTCPLAAQAEPDGTTPTATPLTANIGLVSSYRFRGLDQTFGHPAVQGGFDYAHPSGFYAGNWNSNVSSGAGYPEGSLEMDFYGGYKTTLGDFGVDVGGLYYYYPGSRLDHAFPSVNQRRPGSTANGNVDNGEVYLAGSWQFLTLKYSHAVTDYFAMPGTRGTGYLDLSASYDLGGGYTFGAHVGRLFMHGFAYTNADGSRYDGRYTDWRLGISKDLAGWIVGAAYVGTTAEGRCGNGEFYCFSSSMASDGSANGSRSRDAGRGIAVLSVARSF
ncbi:TorF family putative porin [Zoogloea sp. LCSB751]|uniref:TorF family putative porin n=1 Tax=Zoogloea sp. LCSB751 TaxID=1965277 RepID=UPI0009A54E85|nr:TorF family putative porin [Zoogloea sp. LCSB751]